MSKTLPKGLYQPDHEHDACGMGFVVHIKGHRSHAIVQQGLEILRNLDHRGAVGADPRMGDGAGILIQIPDQLYRQDMASQGVTLPPPGEYGVGMVFLPREDALRRACEQALEHAVQAEGQRMLGWRDVQVDQSLPMSPFGREREPVIRQLFIGRGSDVMVPDALERKLYLIRKTSSHTIRALNSAHGKACFVPSMSTRTVTYKGLLLADQVGRYYSDLADPRTVSALAMVHQRFSTNTFPAWELAHPYRMVAHNGEINTVKGNVNWLNACTGAVTSPVLGDDLQKIWPLIDPGQSDTASFDNCLELLTMAGYPLAHAVMMMIPEAWERHGQMNPDLRAFYEYHAAMMEPWDGPAAIIFTDGRQVGATLDRNGLRPARYLVTDDDRVILASEAGVLPVPQARIVKKWRLQPGRMLLIDMEAGCIMDDRELKDQLAHARPYRQWIERMRIRLDTLPLAKPEPVPEESLLDRQKAFGYSQEDLKFLLRPMAQNGQEATGSMGNDSPLAVLSSHSKSLYHYFRQMFAQVTNPSIDPIREYLVMSLMSFIGPRPDLLDISNINPPWRLEVSQPVLNAVDMARIRRIDRYSDGKLHSYELDITYPLAWGREGIEAHLASLCAQAVDAIARHHTILVVSDRHACRERVAIPALLATSAVHQYLVSHGLRTSTGLVVETGSAREVHHFALLAGYGAEAIHPWLAMETVAQLFTNAAQEMDADQAIRNYVRAINKGLQKVMSKMGISTYRSYVGTQIFEALGLNRKLVDTWFTGTPSRIEGIGLFGIAEEALRQHATAYGDHPVLTDALPVGGEYAWRTGGDEHMWTPDAIATLQHATRANQVDTYARYARLINDQTRRQMTLRGLFEFRFDPACAIALDEVEPASDIVRRFVTGAMSLGSISTEAHTTLAVAMNRIGGKSSTGEGGEDEARYRNEQRGIATGSGETLASVLGQDRIESDMALLPGDSLRSRIKQVASGRFGVTAAYLVSADQIQIKIAQGAKPGEGGQLPGHKVSSYIAQLRFSVPGVGLISPPPHHDIYSIEDLAQLVHDLKNCNPAASISVKLVAEAGVGTVAAGVAKAKADHVVIAGHDGGTGASPWSSIKHAGIPWELGLAETQQTLVQNHLRGRIRVQVDGQIKTGRDVVIGALLGADEFGFATAPLVVEGCIMMRKCHLNTCPTGIATQDPVLRRRFSGRPEHVVNYFFFVAEEVRQIMARLGVRSFDKLIGQTGLLDLRPGTENWKARGLDFSRVFYRPTVPAGVSWHHDQTQAHHLEQALDWQWMDKASAALERAEKTRFIVDVSNLNRAVGTMLSGEVARCHGHAGLPDDTLHIQLNGTAGQSFGAFLARGITLYLVGEGNDYVGKGLSGGRIIVRFPNDFRGNGPEHIIVGNTVLYGAIEGEAYIGGVAGERFAVRNSGAIAVVEGVGDHGCEYMTGGTVVVLGRTGRNFAAGMSGGVAYVYDPKGMFEPHCNQDMVTLEVVASGLEQASNMPAPCWHRMSRESQPETDEAILCRLLEAHVRHTGSVCARHMLDDWPQSRACFIKVMPVEYRRALLEGHENATRLSGQQATV